jgi:hypothetical protein
VPLHERFDADGQFSGRAPIVRRNGNGESGDQPGSLRQTTAVTSVIREDVPMEPPGLAKSTRGFKIFMLILGAVVALLGSILAESKQAALESRLNEEKADMANLLYWKQRSYDEITQGRLASNLSSVIISQRNSVEASDKAKSFKRDGLDYFRDAGNDLHSELDKQAVHSELDKQAVPLTPAAKTNCSVPEKNADFDELRKTWDCFNSRIPTAEKEYLASENSTESSISWWMGFGRVLQVFGIVIALAKDILD